MSDGIQEAIDRTKEELERVGFTDVMVESIPTPDYIMTKFPVPIAVEEIVYFRVTTHLGTFGIFPFTEGGLVCIDITELGLTREEVLGDPEDGGPWSAPDFMIMMRGFLGMSLLRVILEAIRAGS